MSAAGEARPSVDDYIRAAVEAAPPLNEDQRARLAGLLAPTRRADRTTRPPARKGRGDRP
ncbi:hypothetical protein GCM10009687_01150 [Asanoa iriomotensis]|uniref:Anti-sigma factor NepR domain-containing protein n=1 Tax=Asanoa iriomotensis TaxID=234613 RepID=A0ABQ4CAP5_9ACTN|nr:hypothetical protein Air01nite_59270 [Asanoa iriomotensis]